MQQDNNYTDKKLQELENQSLPDLSKMDAHWQQMKAALEPAVVAAKVKPLKRYFWMVAAILTAGIFTVFVMVYQKPSKPTGQVQVQDAVPATIMKQTQKDSLPAINSVIEKKDIAKPKTKIYFKQISSPSNLPEPVIMPGIANEQTPAETASLEKFFKQLEKQTQQFVIDNKRDTIITGEDGTALLIPANTFKTEGEVIITLKEFYSYEDIITNKLTTTSNGEQLVTGGMIHLTATADGKEITIDPGKSIRWFVPDTTSEMKEMQLFTGTTSESSVSISKIIDENVQASSIRTTDRGIVNWTPENRFFSNRYLVTMVKVLDLKNEPVKTRIRKEGKIGIFRMAENSKISEEELKAELKEKYDYHKVIIKTRNNSKGIFRRWLTPRFLRWDRWVESLESLGDSAWVYPGIAQKYGLVATDTISYPQSRISMPDDAYLQQRFGNVDMNSLAKKFSVDIRTLGWINCDRFYRDKRPKIDYYVDIKDTARNYYTVLVFENIRSLIPGAMVGNKVYFANLPEGAPAKVISIGIQNGKTVAAMETVKISKTPLKDLRFEATDPVAFREEVKELDN